MREFVKTSRIEQNVQIINDYSSNSTEIITKVFCNYFRVMDNSAIVCFNHLNCLFRSFLGQQAFNDIPCFANIIFAIMKFAPKIAFFCCVFTSCEFVCITFIQQFGNFISFKIMRLLNFLLFLNGNFDAFCNPRLEHKFRLSAGKKFKRRMFVYNTLENVDEFGKL